MSRQSSEQVQASATAEQEVLISIPFIEGFCVIGFFHQDFFQYNSHSLGFRPVDGNRLTWKARVTGVVHGTSMYITGEIWV